ncbi:MAG: DNA cytosine methyltransferase [Rhodococcus sp. (in: high G+C Gram-positive bacteria)]
MKSTAIRRYQTKPSSSWTFADLFSGAGGMSCGFARHGEFEVVGAVDAQLGKPSSARGSLECNSSYADNIGISPHAVDLMSVSGVELSALFEAQLRGRTLDVLSACPPCTGFSRANPQNHISDDPRNSLVTRVADAVAALDPTVLVMENARELVAGNFSGHLNELTIRLDRLGYDVDASVHMLTEFGLPQRRERSLVIAVRRDHPMHTMSDLWSGIGVDPAAITVRRAIGHLTRLRAGDTSADDSMHVSPSIGRDSTYRRLRALPHDGGSWRDLRAGPTGDEHLTPAMRRLADAGRLGSHPDVYGRMWWDRPAPTIKRECAHFGNGRYTHPEQDRLCTVRELALLNGFPDDYVFRGKSLSNMYRHIGDAVPPLISAQLAALCAWILTDTRPDLRESILPGTSLRAHDLLSSDPDLVSSDSLDTEPARLVTAGVPLDLEDHQR